MIICSVILKKLSGISHIRELNQLLCLLQETLERLRERKQELKQETIDLKAELEDSKKAHR